MSRLCGRTLIEFGYRTVRSIHRSATIGYQLKCIDEKLSFIVLLPTKNSKRNLCTKKFVNHKFEWYSKYSESAIYFLAAGISGAFLFYICMRSIFPSVVVNEVISILDSNRKTILAYSNLPSDLPQFHKSIRHDLPSYSMADVSQHQSNDRGIWITYGVGVYDITQFVQKHPGGDKILMGAGSSIDQFWQIYQQHNTPEILQLLETFRIGNLLQEGDTQTINIKNPWSNEPSRNAALIPITMRPFNAEPTDSLLVEQFFTPNEFFYVRNHWPVPDIDVDDYELEIEIEGTNKKKTLTFKDIKSLPKHDIVSVIMCGGNRRSQMAKVKPIKGIPHKSAAVGNAVWSGPKLHDILKEMGVESNEHYHVHFEGLDMDPILSTCYSVSIPLVKAMDPRGDVILAYEMNGKPLSRDHGYPIRVVCPGIVGARNCKWVGRIVVSDRESDSHWQQNDYKGFSPSTDWDTVDFSKSPAIQNMPVMSAICSPNEDEFVSVDKNGIVMVKGYAWSGGGASIVRVDVSADGGKSWQVANLDHGSSENDNSNLYGRNWAWSLWTAEIPIPKNVRTVEIWSKAVDSNYNVQPETFENIWNLRGMLSNAYSRIQLKIK